MSNIEPGTAAYEGVDSDSASEQRSIVITFIFNKKNASLLGPGIATQRRIKDDYVDCDGRL